MKKIFIFLLFISAFAQAQYTVNATLTEPLATDWVILYRIENGQQKFVKNTTIKKDTILVEGEKQVIGNFTFSLPQNTPAGSYRTSYKTEENGFVDFIFNKENIRFAFHPEYPEQTTIFSESLENITYKNYLNDITQKQQKLDSLQVKAIQNPQLNLSKKYKKTLAQINKIQQKYLAKSNGMYVQPFIKATLRANTAEIKTTVEDYMSNMKNTFFDNMDFSNKTLINSSFLINRISDYVFYLNFSDNKNTQQKLYKKSIETVFTKTKDVLFKKEAIVFLIEQFETTKNLEMIDFLFENYYEQLPRGLQNQDFIEEKKNLFAAEVGRIAPNFSWKEKGKKLNLSTLKGAENFVLVFWSTGCSHCLKEIPNLHDYLQENTKVKVVAFAMERNDLVWNNMKVNLPNWHHVLGLNKWDNKVARNYNIIATPSYFLLDKNKKIIAKPEELEDLKKLVENLE
ncbi:TlpA disulfide reductase family protein [uncultured Polaribacter sp.]|uniref:TlpA family protein disulfide reductase n=1 Tax=uncultured Polaribacter sp. TaxID=174711 RepID=UPI0026345B24|nr:TlpA disulfide reductase family protein [uncultured Polaribacter sp.]